jgi:hypothetical protein
VTERQVQEYAAWLAEQRGLALDAALAYARRPRRWLAYQPPEPAPIDLTNVVYLDAWRRAS